jgi:hypothetical protein
MTARPRRKMAPWWKAGPAPPAARVCLPAWLKTSRRVSRTSSSLPLSARRPCRTHPSPQGRSAAPSPRYPAFPSTARPGEALEDLRVLRQVSREWTRMARALSRRTFRSTLALTPFIPSSTSSRSAWTPICRLTRLTSSGSTEAWDLRSLTIRWILSTPSSETSSSTATSWQVGSPSGMPLLVGGGSWIRDAHPLALHGPPGAVFTQQGHDAPHASPRRLRITTLPLSSE